MLLPRPRAEPASSSFVTKLLLANIKLSGVRGSGSPCLSAQHKHFTHTSDLEWTLQHISNGFEGYPLSVHQLQNHKKWLCALPFFFPSESTKVSFAESQQSWHSHVDLLDTEDPTSFWAMLWSIVIFESTLICLLELVFQGRLQSFTVPCFFSQQRVPCGCEWLCLTIYIDMCVPV